MTEDTCREMLSVLKEMVRIWKGPRELAGVAFAAAINRAEAVIAKAEREDQHG